MIVTCPLALHPEISAAPKTPIFEVHFGITQDEIDQIVGSMFPDDETVPGVTGIFSDPPSDFGSPNRGFESRPPEIHDGKDLDNRRHLTNGSGAPNWQGEGEADENEGSQAPAEETTVVLYPASIDELFANAQSDS